MSRNEVCKHYGWEPEKSIVAVYAANWFDFPHAFGMSHFDDFFDWINSTLEVANYNTDVNWLFKAHPIDERYGGVTLSDLIPADQAGHIGLVPDDWNGNTVMRAARAIVTYHGTSAIEYAAMGKPALVPDRGWYHDTGVVLWARSRQAYLDYLAGPWWQSVDTERCRERAEIFAGWYMSQPDWQADLLMDDDSRQDQLYPTLLRMLQEDNSALGQEMQTIRDWFLSDERLYHTYKMRHADRVVAAA